MPTSSTKRASRWPLLLGGVLLLILVAGVVAGVSNDTEEPSEEGAAPPVGGVSDEMREMGESLARRDAGDPMAMGEPEAPVVLVVYSDYQCPFCAKWVQETQPELVERYVDNGELRIEWREFPYMSESSETLALGARAAAEQDAFWDYQGAVYEAQDEVKDTTGAELEERMAEIAGEVGMDSDQLVDDLQREDLSAEVDADFAEGQQLGVSGTPAFVINGDLVMGAQPLDTFTASIDTALSETEE